MNPDDPKAQPQLPIDSAEGFYVKLPNGPQVSSADALRTEQTLLERLRVQGPRAGTLKPLAIFYGRVGQQETAYRYLKLWMKQTKNSEELAECLLLSGQLAEQVDQPKAAIAFYREALQLKPNERQVNYFLRNNLAYCLNGQAEYHEALEHSRLAAEIDPSRANAFKNQGVSYQGLGRYAEAAKAWIKAVHTDASDQRAFKLLEELWQHQAEVLRQEIPEIEQKLEACRHALATAKTGRFADWARGLTLN